MDLPGVVAGLTAKGFRPMIVSNDLVLSHLERRPFGIDVEPYAFNAPPNTEFDVSALLQISNVMNGLAFGPRGLPMPSWVMVDLALMPTAFVLLALPQSRVREFAAAAHGGRADVLQCLLDDAGTREYSGPIPVAGYCASPSAIPGRWIGWSLCSVIDGLSLATVAKALALGVYRAEFLEGITQFDNPSLRIHTRFGRLRIREAHVPLHTSPHSFIYETDLTAPHAVLRNLATRGGNGEPTFLLDPRDVARQLDMQGAIRGGSVRYDILPPGHVVVGDRTLVPILETGAAAIDRVPA